MHGWCVGNWGWEGRKVSDRKERMRSKIKGCVSKEEGVSKNTANGRR